MHLLRVRPRLRLRFLPKLWLTALVVLTVIFGATSSMLAENLPQSSDGVTYVAIRPSETDGFITAFNDAHWVYVSPVLLNSHDPKLPADRHELLLWLPGTRPRNAPSSRDRLTRGVSHTFCMFAARLGYHVISLSYPNTISTSSCNNDPDPGAFAAFRRAIIAGGNTPEIGVSTSDSIQNRLVKVLRLLGKRFPGEGWDEYLKPDDAIPWEKIAVAGQSQGGGLAAFIGVRRSVARVLCFGAPKDYSMALKAPATWYAETSATPKDRFFAFNHRQDRQGCTPEHQLDNLRALGLEQFGPAVTVDTAAPPFENSHILMTNYPGTTVSSETAHGEMINPANSDRFAEVWRYMLTKQMSPEVKKAP